MKANRITFDRIKKSPYKTLKRRIIDIDKLQENIKALSYNARKIEKGMEKIQVDNYDKYIPTHCVNEKETFYRQKKFIQTLIKKTSNKFTNKCLQFPTQDYEEVLHNKKDR